MKLERRIALLVGAGFSRDAGLPMSVDLAGRLRDNLVSLSNSNAPEKSSRALIEFENARLWLSLLNFIDGGVRFREGALDRNPGRPVNIEQIAISADELMTRSRSQLLPYVAGWHRRIDDLEALNPDIIKGFLDFMYMRLAEELTLSQPKRACYMEGLKDLCGIEGHDLDVYSLNYDLCVETALTAAQVAFANGFDQKGQWSPESFEGNCSIRLFKMHGSLDWIDDQVYGLCSLQFPPHESSEKMQTDDSRPTLIFGTTHKLSAREPFLTLAYHFSQRVLNTKILATVGYSFGDEHVNEIIAQGMRKNTGLRILVVAPRADEIVESVDFLNRDPRVSNINAGTATAFNDRLLRDAIRQSLQEVSEENPF